MEIIELEKPDFIGEFDFSGIRLRYYRRKDDPIFNAADVSLIFGIKNTSKILSRIDEDKRMMCIREGRTGKRVSWFIDLDELIGLVYKKRKSNNKNNLKEFVKNIVFETYKNKKKCKK